MQNTLRIAAMLLGYPTQELQEEAHALALALRDETALSRPRRAAMERLLLRMARGDLLELQAEYSEHFDRSRSLSLHLFEHVHGDNRERGQAMIDLGGQYLAEGFYLDSGELPDFIPVFLEFASCLPPREAREWLAQPGHVFAALTERLQKRHSPYAAIFAALVELGGERLDRNALEELQRNEPDDDPARLDEQWEEAPVTFGGAHEMGGPTGFTAKIRAANRPVGKEQA
ncbi:nitrate reductase molybdenum cofactor assembly chaperone [Novosphingobium sp. BL-8H]|uniref:nitrate reductase molybdenum cofactor assembly chaperone n=1 Tax=Novosphingobium sp. BL-8H TaxID=3127640 RepID=UPI003757D0AD